MNVQVLDGSDKTEANSRETFEKMTGIKLEEKTLKPIAHSNHRENMIRDHKYKESSTDFLAALEIYEQGETSKGLALMSYVATEKHHPCAGIIMASEHFRGDGVPKSIPLSEKFLSEALSYGLIEKQFCTKNL